MCAGMSCLARASMRAKVCSATSCARAMRQTRRGAVPAPKDLLTRAARSQRR
jgi:hypothetical protein